MTTSPPYTTHANSKIGKVLAFFQANPDEELTVDDMAAKFGIVRGSVHTVLRPAIDAGLLTRTRDDLGEYVYTRGGNEQEEASPSSPSLPTKPSEPVSPAATTLAWPSAPIGSQRGKRKLMLDPRQIEALPVDTDVPFQPSSKHEGHKWERLFNKLTEPGHSVQFPVEWKTAVAATAAKLNRKATDHAWRVRVVSQTHTRLWRLAK